MKDTFLAPKPASPPNEFRLSQLTPDNLFWAMCLDPVNAPYSPKPIKVELSAFTAELTPISRCDDGHCDLSFTQQANSPLVPLYAEMAAANALGKTEWQDCTASKRTDALSSALGNLSSSQIITALHAVEEMKISKLVAASGEKEQSRIR